MCFIVNAPRVCSILGRPISWRDRITNDEVMARSGQKAFHFHGTVVTKISDFGQPHWQTWPQKSEWIAEDGKRIGRLKWLCYKSSNICVDFLYFKKHTQFGVFSMHVRFTFIIMTRFLFFCQSYCTQYDLLLA